MSWDNKVVWTEGMFLRAQHFQQFDRYVEKLVRGRVGGLRAHSWGFTELQINRELLTTGKFAITACRGVLEDGTPFAVPEDVDHPPPLDMPENTRNCLVYLALPIRQPGRFEMAANGQDEAAARYGASEYEATDANAGIEGVARLRVGRLRLRYMPKSKQEAAGITNILAGPTSPLKSLLSDIARQTKLTAPPQQAQSGASQVTGTAQELGKQEALNVIGSKGRGGQLLSQLLVGSMNSGGGAGGTTGAPAPPEQSVEERFKDLQDYVSGSPAPIDELIQAINAVYLALNNALSQMVPSAGPDSALNAALQQLRAVAGRAPAAVATQVTAMSTAVEGIEKGAVSGNLNDAYQAAVVPYCSKFVANRYPIFADGNADVTLDDFSRLFAPGGVLDGFFKANLMQFVDTSRIPWRAQGGLAISPGGLEQFRIAGLIRDSMFAQGNSPSARFEVVPIALDNAATQVLLEVDGQSVTYGHGPQVPVQMQWPGTGVKQARLSFQPQTPNSSITMDGPCRAEHRARHQDHPAGARQQPAHRRSLPARGVGVAQRSPRRRCRL